jgi:hypothetical protein
MFLAEADLAFACEGLLVEISHIFRETNQCAEASANLDCFHDSQLKVFDRCPSSIKDLYNLDMLRNINPRLICL